MKKLSLFYFIIALVALNLSLTPFANAQPTEKAKDRKFRQVKNPIPNNFIVVLNEEVIQISDILPLVVRREAVEKISENLRGIYGGRIRNRYAAALKGFAVEMSRNEAIRLSQDPRVLFVEEDSERFPSDTQVNPTWGLDRIDQRTRPIDGNYNFLTRGTGVHAYVIDSGIRSTHQEFAGRIGSKIDFVPSPDNNNGEDCSGHGTHVAGTIGGTTYGVAKGVTIHSLRVFACTGSSPTSRIVQAIDWATANHPSGAPGVVNMSLGGEGQSSSEQTAITNSINNKGLIYVVAAGNANSNACNYSPAFIPAVITVGAINRFDGRARFSNWGSCVDLFAPGQAIVSAGIAATQQQPNPDLSSSTKQGTSMSAPHVSGAVARYLQSNPGANQAAVDAFLKATATQNVLSPVELEGSPNLLLYADPGFAPTPPPAPTPTPSGTPRIVIADNGPASFGYGAGLQFSSSITGIISSDPGNIEISIIGLTHTYPQDIAFVLVKEETTGNKALLIQGRAGGSTPVNYITYVISEDNGTVFMTSNPLLNGWGYKPTAMIELPNFPSPGPGTNYNAPLNLGSATLASTFGGSSLAGSIWRLYTLDRKSGDIGTVQTWSMSVRTVEAPSPTPTPTPTPSVTPTPAITINDNTTATPYPANFTISNMTGAIANTPGSVQVQINNFYHTYTGDVSLLLEGPTGARLLLQGRVGDGNAAGGINYTISDSGASQMTNSALLNGTTYKPTNLSGTLPNFPSPGPGTSYNNPGPSPAGSATFASTFSGTDPNGIWKLYVIDQASGDVGGIGSWSVSVTTTATPTPTPTITPTPTPSPVVTPTPTPIPGIGNSAAFLRTDTSTSGNWINVYGSQGYNLADGPSNLPNWLQMSLSGQANYTWAPSTADQRALQKPANPADRFAATWYTFNTFDINLNFTDGQYHQIAVYCLDWDTANGRSQELEILDGNSNAVIDARQISNFSGGAYLLWRVSGNVKIRVKNLGPNAVVSGVFVDAASSSPTPTPTPTPVVTPTPTPTVTPTPGSVNTTASFVAFDDQTKGNWSGVYGSQGFSIIGEGQSIPSWLQMTPSGHNEYVWTPSTADPRALRKAANLSDRIAGTWYTFNTLEVNFNFTDGQLHRLAVYNLDWDTNNGRTQELQIVDAVTNQVIDSKTISNFREGVYAIWNVSGNIKLRMINQGPNAVVSGFFIDAASNSPAPSPTPTPVVTPTPTPTPGPVNTAASFVGLDATTKGNWLNVYGTQGFNLAGGPVSLQSWAQVSLAGQANYTWTNSTTDPRALQKPDNPSDRFAATWYTFSSYDISISFTDGQSHRVALYNLDWDTNNGRTQQIDVLDANTNAVLDSRTVSSFTEGVYAVWNISGSVKIRVTNQGPNAVASAVFIDAASSNPTPSPTPTVTPTPGPVNTTASFIAFDDQTKGNWNSVYGSQGFSIIGDTQNLPSWLQTSATGNNFHVWAPSTNDPRALRKATNPNDRIAGTWYTFSTQEINFNFTDGQTHRLAIYSLDWDTNNTRSQQLQVIDANTNAVLDTRTINSFREGVYAIWNVSGNIKLRIVNQGPNAVVSGFFVDAATGNNPTPTPSPTPVITPSPTPTPGPVNTSVSFVGLDSATKGNWLNVYGTQGFNLANGPASLQNWTQMNITGQANYTWAGSTNDPRALIKPDNPSDRFAATWYTFNSMEISLNLTDGQTHRVALYCLDWDTDNTRSQTLEVIDAQTNAVLDSRVINTFKEGVYVVWQMTGNVKIRIINQGPNAVLSSVFID